MDEGSDHLQLIKFGPSCAPGRGSAAGRKFLAPHYYGKRAVKLKVHTLDIAPLRSESPLQKRSGMARVLEGFHSFTCTPTCSSTIGMSHTCLCLPSCNWYSFIDPGGMEG